jgi:hypothetical protein
MKGRSRSERYLRSIGLDVAREALESLTEKLVKAEVIAFGKSFGNVASGAENQKAVWKAVILAA